MRACVSACEVQAMKMLKVWRPAQQKGPQQQEEEEKKTKKKRRVAILKI